MENEICKLLIMNLFDDRIILKIISILLESIKFTEPFSLVSSLRETLKAICNGMELTYYEHRGLEFFPNLPNVRIEFSDFRDGRKIKEILQEKNNFDFGNYSDEGTPWKPEKKFYNFKHNNLLSIYFEKPFKNTIKNNFNSPHSLRDEILYGCVYKIICDAYRADKMVSVVLITCLALDGLASDIYMNAISSANTLAIEKIKRMRFLKKVLHHRVNLDEEANVIFNHEQQEYQWVGTSSQQENLSIKKLPPKKSSSSSRIHSKWFREKMFANLTLSNSTRQNEVQIPEELRKTIVMTNEFLQLQSELKKWNNSINCVSILLHLSNICQQAIILF